MVEVRTINNKRKADAKINFKFQFKQFDGLKDGMNLATFVSADLRGTYTITVTG